MRLVLVFLLTLAQVAGPWLCCCGPSRLAAAPRVPAAPPEPEHCPHCPHCPPKPAVPDAPAETPAVPERCPCCLVVVVAVPADKPDPTPADITVENPTIGWPVFVSAGREAVRPPVGLRELPHLTTSDRLFAHHVLRC